MGANRAEPFNKFTCYLEHIEGKGISSFTISQNGNDIFKKNYSKKKVSIGVMTVIFLIIAAIFTYYSYSEAKFTVCKTKSCLQSSLTLMNCMNETVDPCEDFYEFACGMFETNYPSSSVMNGNSWISIISIKVKHIVKKFLTQKNQKYEPEAIHKTRMFYEACLNPVKDTVPEKYDPLWAVWEKLGLNNNYLKDSTPLEIEKILAQIKNNLGLDIFFEVCYDDDPRNSSSHSLLIINQNEVSDKFNKGSKTEIEDNLMNFNADFKLVIDRLLSRNDFKMVELGSYVNVKELNEFKAKFFKIFHKTYLFKNDIPEIFTIKQIQNFTDSVGEDFEFNWTLFLRELFRDVEPKIYEQLMSANSDNFEILISNKDYLYDMFELFSKTRTVIIKTELLLRVVNTLDIFFPLGDTFDTEYCLSLTSQLFGMVTGYSMINTLDNSSKAALAEMTENIKWALQKMVKELEWMDDKTKNATLRKLANTKSYIGYPKNYISILNILFQDLNITGCHVKNMLNILVYSSKNQWKMLIKDKDWETMEWAITPAVVNAYNYNSMNAFFIPAAILQPPLYHNGIQALNYGITGSTIGHELSHNYDNSGRLYNELGNVAQWWTNTSHEAFMKRANCLANHYNDIKVVRHDKTFDVNGIQTLDENIADIAGLKESYYAYQRYLDQHGREPKLPGLEQYNQEQLFFLGFANQYCHYDTNNNQFDGSNKHSPNTVRVRGVLSLIPEFAKAWSCPIGSPMNPKNVTCQIW